MVLSSESKEIIHQSKLLVNQTKEKSTLQTAECFLILVGVSLLSPFDTSSSFRSFKSDSGFPLCKHSNRPYFFILAITWITKLTKRQPIPIFHSKLIPPWAIPTSIKTTAAQSKTKPTTNKLFLVFITYSLLDISKKNQLFVTNPSSHKPYVRLGKIHRTRLQTERLLQDSVRIASV